MAISIRNIHKRFGDHVALKDVSLDIRTGELIALLGPSGSGKTSLLRIIAGLEIADRGSVILHYALFRHMTVFDNVAFGMRMKPKQNRLSDEDIRRRVLSLLDLVHLEGMHKRYPAQLSGGQRQRVALARALAVQPDVLLLDEPFGALDAKVRKDLRHWLRQLHQDLNITTVFVTHDQEEAMEMSDRVVVMDHGTIEQVGTPADIYHHPANAFVYDFLGNYNEFAGFETGEQGGEWTLESGIPGRPVRLFSRPHDTDILREPLRGKSLPARIVHINPAGPMVTIDLAAHTGTLLQAAISHQRQNELALQKGEIVFVTPREVRVFG
jgi:sulfate/thiosulfate transport system ATP-binding protein